ncbi:MAG: ASKHA domain-containing protein [Chloroflexota bacterium]
MANHSVTFQTGGKKPSKVVSVSTGTLVTEAAQRADLEISQPCGGQGRCGRCIVQVKEGEVRRRSTLRLTPGDIERGFALGCQTVVESDLQVLIPPQDQIIQKITTNRVAVDVSVPAGYDFERSQPIRRVDLRLKLPSMDDQTDDWSRLQTSIRSKLNLTHIDGSIGIIRRIGEIMRDADWLVTVILDMTNIGQLDSAKVVDLRPGPTDGDDPLWAIAVDIGTTTVTVWLVDLVSGQVKAQASEYNGQIARGEDVVSRIIYASKADGASDLHDRVTGTINGLIVQVCKRAKIKSKEVVKATVVGNSTMIHLLLKVPAASIRLAPFITGLNYPPLLSASEIGFDICPDAVVDCLPGVASYVGADITAGVLSSGVDTADEITLFIDVGTNGEIVLGNRDWLVTCACSAGPAFEGAGVVHGMRATDGAIEEVWINSESLEPIYRVIGGGKPRGLCGSGLISLMAEMFLAGILDKSGNINLTIQNPRVRQGESSAEFVVAWASETDHGEDIIISRVDIDNLLRVKAAIYAGFAVLADQVGMDIADISRMLIGGSFGKYINVEKAVQIGLLPDMEWSKFEFLGNTAIRGAYYSLLSMTAREQVEAIARKMTYIELSADNTFYDAFMAAMFLPHTDLGRFPTVEAVLAS